MEELPLSSQDAIDDDDGDDRATRITYASLYLCTKCSYGVRAVRGVNERRIGRKQSERRRSLFPILMRAYLRVAAAVCLWRSGSCSTSDATRRALLIQCQAYHLRSSVSGIPPSAETPIGPNERTFAFCGEKPQLWMMEERRRPQCRGGSKGATQSYSVEMRGFNSSKPLETRRPLGQFCSKSSSIGRAPILHDV